MTLKNRANFITSQVIDEREPESIFLTSTNSVFTVIPFVINLSRGGMLNEACSADTPCSDCRLARSDGRSFDKRPYRSKVRTGLHRKLEKLRVPSSDLQLSSG